MKPSRKVSLKDRAAEKKAAREADRKRLELGESPEVIQRENSIFPPGYFDHCRIMNLNSAIGR